MKNSTCQLCEHYQFHGRSGGFCHQLGASVRGNWGICTLVQSLFTDVESVFTSSEELVKIDQDLSFSHNLKKNCLI